jgi:hypothetical protein
MAFARVALRSLWVAQPQPVFRFGLEGEEDEGLDQVGILEVAVRNPLDLDLGLAHNRSAGHLEEAHIPQLDQVESFLEVHSLRVGGLPDGLGLIVNWEAAVGVVASALGEQDGEQGQDLGLVGRVADDY